MMDFVEVWSFVKENGTATAAGVAFVYGLYSRKLRWGWDYNELQDKCDRSEQKVEKLIGAALRNAGATQLALELVEAKGKAE